MRHLIEALPTATKFTNEMACDALFHSCEVLFYGDKTGFLAKCTSQPPVLKQKSTSQVVKSTSQVAVIKSQPKISTARVSRDVQQYPSPMALPR